MEVIEITIQIEPGTEEIHIAAESKDLGPEMVIYIDGQGKVMLVDMEDALKIMDNFGNNCTSAMIGKSEYILAYDAGKTVKADGHTYMACEGLIMKSYYGLKPMSRIEVMAAMNEFKSRQVPLNVGPFGIMAYEV